MKLEYFKRDFKRMNGVQLCKDWVMWRKPFNIWNEKTDETIKAKNLDQALDIVVEGKTVREHIEAIEKYEVEDQGSGGSSSGGKGDVFKFTSASDAGGGGDAGDDGGKILLNAKMNTKIKTKTYESALKAFEDEHRHSDREYAISVDRDGFVYGYAKGGKTSVGVNNRAGKVVIHNHPAGADGKGHSFSKADLQNTARGYDVGKVAVAPEGTYSFLPTHKFKGQAFEKALSRAKPRGKDYDDATGKWLTANQDKYGYKYSFTKAKKSKVTKSKVVKSKVDVKKLANGTAKQLDLF